MFMVAVVLALLMMLSACSSAPPSGPGAAKSLIDESAAAMGGWAALDSIKSQEIVTGGADVEPLQAMDPSGQPPRLINNFGQTITVDYEKSRMRLSFDAIREYPAKNPLKFVEVIEGDGGMLETPQPDGKTMQERMHPSRFATRLRDMRRMPMRLLYTAKNAPDVTREADKGDGKTTINILHFSDAGQKVEIQLDSFNKLPLR